LTYSADPDDYVAPKARADVLGAAALAPLRYVGLGLSVDKFEQYLESYDFGKYPPTFVVLHHTSIPDTQAARLNDGSWDEGDEGRSDNEIYGRRLRMLGGIRDYYARTYPTWPAGPHLFIDDRYVWIFSPMNAPGVHAASGNGTARSYSVGIEVIGHYEHVRWPAAVEENVGRAVVALRRRLGTFQITHKRGPGGVSCHRDYNKPSCPGSAITDDYYLDVIGRYTRPVVPTPVLAVGDTQVDATYMVMANLNIRQEPRTLRDDGRTPVKMAGTLRFGTSVKIDVVKTGEKVIDTDQWGHLADGRGFVTMRYLRKV
jgi:hypothetical protein